MVWKLDVCCRCFVFVSWPFCPLAPPDRVESFLIMSSNAATSLPHRTNNLSGDVQPTLSGAHETVNDGVNLSDHKIHNSNTSGIPPAHSSTEVGQSRNRFQEILARLRSPHTHPFLNPPSSPNERVSGHEFLRQLVASRPSGSTEYPPSSCGPSHIYNLTSERWVADMPRQEQIALTKGGAQLIHYHNR